MQLDVQALRAVSLPGRAPRTEWWRLLPLASTAGLLAPIYAGASLISRSRRSDLATPAGAKRALAHLGLRTDSPIEVAPLSGGLSNAIVAVRIGGYKLVLKQALPVGTVLAFGAGRFGPMPYGRAVSGPARLGRELDALTLLRAAGVRVPAVVAADPSAGLLLLEYVEGEPLVASAGQPEWLDRVAAFGRAIAAAHQAGVVLTDCHPGNALLTSNGGKNNGGIALLDLEFAEPKHVLGNRFAERCAFDIAYAAAFFEADERTAFTRGAGRDPDSDLMSQAAARLRPFAPLFARERQRQRSCH